MDDAKRKRIAFWVGMVFAMVAFASAICVGWGMMHFAALNGPN